MSSNVGLSTPRGSGTSGYVQRNLAHLKPRDNFKPYPTDLENLKHRQRKPDKEILDHDRKRDVEVRVFELRDQLEDEGVSEDEIEKKTAELREKLLAQSEKGSIKESRGLKMHQVHELAEAKIKESDRFRNALGISKNYEEGDHWKKQAERLKAAVDKSADEEKLSY